MAQRLYREDSYMARCTARILSAVPAAGGLTEVELDRTVFYPTGGGQPHDTGMLAGLPVVDVSEAGEGRIRHMVRAGDRGPDLHGEVSLEVDWRRRFDHMQQHTGQHILSQAFARSAGAATTSFHLGARECTIDIELPEASEAIVRRAEAIANGIVFSDAGVSIRSLPADEAGRVAAGMNLVRELALAPGEPIRIIVVGDFDETPCGGTHVRRAGEVGCVAIRSWERSKGGTRVTFVCGGRVVTEFAALAGVVDACVARLSARPPELAAAVDRLVTQLGEARREGKALSEALAGCEAVALDASARDAGKARVVVETFFARGAGEVQELARKYVQSPARVALLAIEEPGDGKTSLVFARSAVGLPDGVRMGEILSAVCSARGGRGGGSDALARGWVPGPETQSALDEAYAALKERLGA